jgi:hypothetical protein
VSTWICEIDRIVPHIGILVPVCGYSWVWYNRVALDELVKISRIEACPQVHKIIRGIFPGESIGALRSAAGISRHAIGIIGPRQHDLPADSIPFGDVRQLPHGSQRIVTVARDYYTAMG